jgi:CheY-like chemotaxis protein
MNILVVDDEPVLRELTELILRKGGHTVTGAEDGAEALEQVELAPAVFDLILTDHNMPNINGLELVERLKANGFAGAIIVWSGSLDNGLRHEYELLGVNRLISKPLPVSTITTVVEEVAEEVAA